MTLGRQYSASNDATSNFASGADWAASGLGYGTRAGDVDNVDTSNRMQNSIKYTSPNYRGLTSRRSVQPGRSGWRLLAQRSHGRSGVVLERRGQARRELHVHQGPVLRDVRRPGQFVDAVLRRGRHQQHGKPHLRRLRVGRFAADHHGRRFVPAGTATIALLYSNTQFQNLGPVTAVGSYGTKYNGGTATFNSGELNVKYALTPALTLAGAYIYTHNSGADNVGSAKYNQFNLGAIYRCPSVRRSMQSASMKRPRVSIRRASRQWLTSAARPTRRQPPVRSHRRHHPQVLSASDAPAMSGRSVCSEREARAKPTALYSSADCPGATAELHIANML